jgi:creatinine amidohydrolase
MKLFAHMNREELRENAHALVILPLGATEQHGPHLATGTDCFSVEAIARQAARIASSEIPVIVAPTLPFGSSHHHLVFGATLSLRTETYLRVLNELLDCLFLDGFRRVFLLNGHGGNEELAELAARDTVQRQDMTIAAASYWVLADKALRDAAVAGCRIPGHAGEFETSIVMALHPELAPERPPSRDMDPSLAAGSPAGRIERHGFWRDIDGYTDSPARGTAEQGKLFVDLAAKEVARAFVDFYRS